MVLISYNKLGINKKMEHEELLIIDGRERIELSSEELQVLTAILREEITYARV